MQSSDQSPSCGLLRMPNEIFATILHKDSLLPHEQVGFAASCRRALMLSNESMKEFAHPHKDVPKIRSFAGEWMAGFNASPIGVQEAIMGTLGILLYPVDPKNMRASLADLFYLVWEAMKARSGAQAQTYLKMAIRTASYLGIHLSEADGIIRDAYEREYHRFLSLAEQAKTPEEATIYVDRATNAARISGHPSPDKSKYVKGAYSKMVPGYLSLANEASDSSEAWTFLHFAKHAAYLAGVQPIDEGLIMQNAWLREGNLHIERAAVTRSSRLRQKHVDAAIQVAHSNGFVMPDVATALNPGRRKRRGKMTLPGEQPPVRKSEKIAAQEDPRIQNEMATKSGSTTTQQQPEASTASAEDVPRRVLRKRKR